MSELATDNHAPEFSEFNGTCCVCGKAAELCQNDACRPCHVSVSWEDCTTRTDNARALLELGLDVAQVRELYPRALLWRENGGAL